MKHLNRAQSTIAYLSIIGITVAIALVTVGISTNFFSVFEPITVMQDKQYWESGTLAISEAIVDANGDAIFLIKNNLLYPIKFAGYTIDNETVLVDDPATFLPGERKLVFIPKIGDCVGECSYKNVFFHYMIQGSEKIFDSGGFDLIPGKSIDLSPEKIFFEGTSNSLICIESGNIQECSVNEFDNIIIGANPNYGIIFCADGNIVIGYLEGFEC
ncbi:MAG: hypothetical protein PHP82_03945 [Candidatus ainarchaeum sp.]|nr:hypothetical protein [Candidatus ainarchaeum sp.]